MYNWLSLNNPCLLVVMLLVVVHHICHLLRNAFTSCHRKTPRIRWIILQLIGNALDLVIWYFVTIFIVFVFNQMIFDTHSDMNFLQRKKWDIRSDQMLVYQRAVVKVTCKRDIHMNLTSKKHMYLGSQITELTSKGRTSTINPVICFVLIYFRALKPRVFV